jgi:hypothetical protein
MIMGYLVLGFAAGVAVCVVAEIVVENTSSSSSSSSFLRAV